MLAMFAVFCTRLQRKRTLLCNKVFQKILYIKMFMLKAHLDWPMHVWLFEAQDDLPGNSDPVEEVVDEAHVVDESVHVTGAQHEQGGQALCVRNQNSQMGLSQPTIEMYV